MWRRAENSTPILGELHEETNLPQHTELCCDWEVISAE